MANGLSAQFNSITLRSHPSEWFRLGDHSYVSKRDVLSCVAQTSRQELDSTPASYFQLDGPAGNYTFTISPIVEEELTSKLRDWHARLLSKRTYLEHIGSTHVPIPELHQITDPRF